MANNSNSPECKLISVIIPAYNAAPFLAETIDSVLASDYPNLEVVIMDDGSKDETFAIAQRYAQKQHNVLALTQPNGGVCVARNQAILQAKGEYILPLDADDTIEPFFLSKAAAILDQEEDVKAVLASADLFGDRTGKWVLPDFSIHLLARKNILPNCGLYRRKDWEQTEGYCKEIIAREDWEFWIALLKNGGRVVKLPEVGLHYRFHTNSKRKSDRKLKRHVVQTLNQRHPEFFERELNGPLHLHRTWSKLLNGFYRFFHPRKVHINPKYNNLEYLVKVLPSLFENEQGKVIHNGRNQLREFQWGHHTVVVKSYCTPNLINRIAYGIFRASKAERSYQYADLLREKGIGSPEPVAWMTIRNGLLLKQSYFVSIKSECPYTYKDLIGGTFPQQEKYLRAIARTTATFHDNGMIHKDYSRGNILFGEINGKILVEIIDLNRIRFRKQISMEEGCKNFAERLPATEEMRKIMAEEYAQARGFDKGTCDQLLANFNIEKS